jgi:hypothetical protein
MAKVSSRGVASVSLSFSLCARATKGTIEENKEKRSGEERDKRELD